MKEINVTYLGRVIPATRDKSVAEIIGGERPCGGHGKCGKCKYIIEGEISPISDTERALLSESELSSGVRLSCLTYPLGDVTVRSIDEDGGAEIVTGGALPSFEPKPTFSKYGAAIDIGTTTLAAKLYDTSGAALSTAAAINPQGEFGADVISRIEAALGGSDLKLAEAVRGALDDLILELARGANISAADIDGVVITGNTVMLSLLVCESVEPHSHAPFAAKRLFGEALLASELGIKCLGAKTEIYLAPCISAFVGADTVCAILATELCERDTAMLCDIGTNGEMALWHGERLTVCSTAAGPAFEGVGISCGMRGGVGAIDRVSPIGGSLAAHVIGDVLPRGICGSGLVDAVAAMLELEIIDEGGYLEDDEYTILDPVALTPKDIRMLQLAKSAICAGLLTLLDGAKLAVSDVPKLYIAGGFGNYLSFANAARIGLLPKKLARVSKTVGNAALSGASMLLLDKDMRARAESIAKSAKTLDLTSSPTFTEKYIEGMMFLEI
ncbi:MAG: DUF4445 domain-containing protein [Clostridia bacterium]|nr:DUF4445 domain-containing protein [Clostridia bacterium]